MPSLSYNTRLQDIAIFLNTPSRLKASWAYEVLAALLSNIQSSCVKEVSVIFSVSTSSMIQTYHEELKGFSIWNATACGADHSDNFFQGNFIIPSQTGSIGFRNPLFWETDSPEYQDQETKHATAQVCAHLALFITHMFLPWFAHRIMLDVPLLDPINRIYKNTPPISRETMLSNTSQRGIDRLRGELSLQTLGDGKLQIFP